MNGTTGTGSLAVACLALAASALAAPKAIKVYRVGSSSFGYALIEDTRAIV